MLKTVLRTFRTKGTQAISKGAEKVGEGQSYSNETEALR